MKQILKYELIISSILVILPFIASFYIFDRLFGLIIGFIGLNGLFIGIAILHLNRTQSSKIVGAYLLIYILIYVWINFEPYEGINSIIIFNVERIDYSIRMMTFLFLIGASLYWIFKNNTLENTMRTHLLRFALILLGIYLITEIPIYGFHGDFGGYTHGHSYWYRFHMH